MAAQNQIYRWDATLSMAVMPQIESLKRELKAHCKKWVFQKEQGGVTGYLHWQIRVSLKEKSRMPAFLVGAHWTPTHDKSWSYVMKEETRVEGPWCDSDEPDYIPMKYRGDIELRPWQSVLLDRVRADPNQDRTIHCVVDSVGNNGKSFLRNYLKFRKGWVIIPASCQLPKDIMAAAKALVAQRREVPGICIDIPRACSKRHFHSLAQAIESIKDGILIEERYHYSEWVIEPPPVVVFSNWVPPRECFSEDRWRITDLSDALGEAEPAPVFRPPTLQRRVALRDNPAACFPEADLPPTAGAASEEEMSEDFSETDDEDIVADYLE